MNKSMLIILGLITANQAFADIGATNGVANSATCDSGALDTDSGGAALEAQYSPETINLKWYDNNTQIDVTSLSDTCTYDNGISLPANPTKTGYTFKGWKVRPEYDFSTLPTNETGTYAWGIDDHTWCRVYTPSNMLFDNYLEYAQNYPELMELNPYEWRVQFSFGTVYGMALCSSVSGTFATSGTPTNGNAGNFCWCKATGYIPNGETVKYSSTNSNWIYYDAPMISNDIEFCTWSCGSYCARAIQTDQSFRIAVFGQ